MVTMIRNYVRNHVRNYIRNHASVVILALAFLAAGLTIHPGAHLRAQSSPPAGSSQQTVTFGMVGLGQGQWARLNALLLPVGGPMRVGACEVTFTFLNDQGITLASSTVPVNQNQAIHFEYAAPPSAGKAPSEIRGTVGVAFNATASGAVAGGSCQAFPTMEIGNGSGQTQIVLENTQGLASILPM
jgi:hypothetical protein